MKVLTDKKNTQDQAQDQDHRAQPTRPIPIKSTGYATILTTDGKRKTQLKDAYPIKNFMLISRELTGPLGGARRAEVGLAVSTAFRDEIHIRRFKSQGHVFLFGICGGRWCELVRLLLWREPIVGHRVVVEQSRVVHSIHIRGVGVSWLLHIPLLVVKVVSKRAKGPVADNCHDTHGNQEDNLIREGQVSRRSAL